MGALFTIDLEDWNHGLHLDHNGHSSIDGVYFLQYKLAQYNVKAIFYVLEIFDEQVPGMVSTIKSDGYVIKSHGRYHYYDEKSDRSPYFNQEGVPFPPSGGFFFRLLPIWYLKWAIKKSGVFWIHPHDLDEKHPNLKNPFMNWKRHVGLKKSRLKLERLLKEVEWDEPRRA